MKRVVSVLVGCMLMCLANGKQQNDCCEQLSCDIAKVEKSVKRCCETLQSQILDLQNTVDNCCSNSETCCEETLAGISQILAKIENCCNGGAGACNTFFITGIPEGGLVITEPGRYIACNNLSFSGEAAALQKKGGATNALVPSLMGLGNPFTTSSFGVTIASNNVFFDLNNNTFMISGENTGGLLILSGFTGVKISNGFIEGDNQPGQFGVAIAAAPAAFAVAAASAAVSNVAFANVAAPMRSLQVV